MTHEHSATFAPAIETPAVARHELERWLPDSLADARPRRPAPPRVRARDQLGPPRRGLPAARRPQRAHRQGTIRVEVRDGGGGFDPGTPRPRSGEEAAGYGGYGLFLVERMASRWGVERDDGTLVWFELDLAPSGR